MTPPRGTVGRHIALVRREHMHSGDEGDASPGSLRRKAKEGSEVVLGLLVALISGSLLVWWSRATINVDPLDRAGQVSSLAGLQLRAAVLMLGGTVLLSWWNRVTGQGEGVMWAPVVSLISGLPAAAFAVTVRHTTNPLYGVRRSTLSGMGRSVSVRR